MRIVHPNILKLFIFLLLTVFITETVYANGMMIVERNSGSNSSQIAVNNDHPVEHCHDMQTAQQDHVQSYNNPQSHNKPQSQSSCTNCSHCFACFTMIPQGQFSVISMRPQKIVATAFAENYLSPTSIQLQKPPIA